MYNVSEDYIEAVKKPFKVRRLTGTVGNISFTEENIASGSFMIDNACSDGDQVKIGSVYMGQLQCVFRGINLAGQWNKKVITVSEELQTGHSTWEAVPLGVYTIYEANRREDGVFVTAYDNMKKFDKKFKLSTTSGTPFDYLKLICTDCGVAMAQTEAQIRALPNGTGAFVLYAENDIETYRDLLFWVAQTMGCFSTINRSGELEIRQYGNSTVDSVGMTERWTGASFSDFETYYTGVSVVNIDDGTTTYKGLEVDDGLTYNLGSNPLLQNVSLNNYLTNILTSLQRIRYTPFVVDRSGCPAYDLGDQITFPDGLGAGATGCIMYYAYTFHGQYRIEGYGANPALADARSKTDKEISGLMKKNAMSNVLQFYTFTNAKQLTIVDDWKEIIYIRFGSLKATKVTFQAEIKVSVELNVVNDIYNDIICNVKYIFNGSELEYHPAETWMDGDHLLHLLYFFTIETSTINKLSVRMKCQNGTLTIDRACIQAAISGQGLASSSDWDGQIECEDEVYPITLNNEPTVVPFTDLAELELQDVIVISAEDNVGEIDLNTGVEPIAFTEIVQINKEPISDYTWNEIDEYTWDQVEDMFYW